MAGIALVTGAGSGIGRAAAMALAGVGWQVALAGRRLEPVQAVAAEIVAAGGSAVAIQCNVASESEVDALFATIADRFGRLDLLFNNAGIGAPKVPFDQLEARHWRRVIDVNLTGSFLCAQRAFAMMKAQDPRGGRIINNGSVSAHSPRPHGAAYTASKHGVTGLTKAITLDGRAFDIACGQIDIGNASTAMGDVIARGVEQANGAILAEPVMDLSVVADAILFMARQPLDANVQFMTVMATKMPLIGRG